MNNSSINNKISSWIKENNHQFLVAVKAAGLPVQATHTNEKGMSNILSAFVKRELHMVNRLDRPVSGLVLFSKKKTANASFQKQMQNGKLSKTYLALVEGKPSKSEETLLHYHSKGRNNKAWLSDEKKEGHKEAKLEYKVLETFDNYSLLEVNLITGRFHQIRAQLASIGYPVKGDVKYGARRSNKDRSIGLHGWKLSFDHPVTGERQHFIADVPDSDNLWIHVKNILNVQN